MGAVAKRVERDGTEWHVGTGKAVRGWEHGRMFEEHAPQWGEWFRDGPIEMRQCAHPDCDLDDIKRKSDV